MRGTNSNHVKVLIDGIDASDPSNPNGSFDFAHLLTSDIERIEALRGPQSGLYGSDAIDGVISIITKKGSGPARRDGDETLLEFVGSDAQIVAVNETPEQILALHLGEE